MDFINRLKGKKIALVGIGYVGKSILDYIHKHVPQAEVYTYSKRNVNEIMGKEFDYVINSAGKSGDFKDFMLETVDSNICLTIFLLKNVKIRKAFLSISSTRIYGFDGKKGSHFNEEMILSKDNLYLDFIYDGSKMLMECILNNYSDKVNYNLVAVRLSNMYGGFDNIDEKTFLKKMIRYALSGEKLITTQNPNDSKDYIFVDDAIEGILRALALSDKKFDIFNIASGESVSIRDFADTISLKINFSGNNSREKHSFINNSKAKSILDFNPKFSFRDGIHKVLVELQGLEKND